MKQKELLSRLEELIQEGERVRASAKPILPGSTQMRVDRGLFMRWKTKCIAFLETSLEDTSYLRNFTENVRSRLLDSNINGLEVLRALKDDLANGYLDSFEEEKVNKSIVDNYVDEKRIEELQSIQNPKYDTVKLVKLCEELNKCYKNKCELAIVALVRTILNHVPPIFGESSFKEVANNYKWGRSNRNSIIRLQQSARDIADNHLHHSIRERESLPAMTQVNFIPELDVLLGEIVRKLKS